MPPKDGGGKKQNEKKKAKTIEDRTFGLKNKNKSKKVQQFVKSVETSVAFAGISAQARREQDRLRAAKEAMKFSKEAAELEKAALFKSVVNKTVVPQGVDPKSVLCEFYKAGKCVRGNKCKYSHDTEQARKVAKIDLYSDPRALMQSDTIDKSVETGAHKRTTDVMSWIHMRDESMLMHSPCSCASFWQVGPG
jgi:hypothetical protein